jgi:hypothetical protein
METIKFVCPGFQKILRLSFAAETMTVCAVVQAKEGYPLGFDVPA